MTIVARIGLVLGVLLGACAALLWPRLQAGVVMEDAVVKGFERYECPENMALVYDLSDLSTAYCIDQYEAQVVGDVGHPDQFHAAGARATGIAVSRPGVVPTRATSFDIARAICANTPVIGTDGAAMGYKRLPTSAQWRDAADGRIGPGGFRWPYGNRFDEHRCVSLTARGEAVYEDILPTASKPGCVSPFGVYDMSGNLWEWADPNMVIDIDAWVEKASKAGLSVGVDEAGYVTASNPADLRSLRMTIVGVLPGAPSISPDGHLSIPASSLPEAWLNGPPDYRGYLSLGPARSRDATDYLPVEIQRMAPRADSDARLFVLREHDGASFTDKRGGAYYTGLAIANSTDESYLGHFHEFMGTIGFRCVCDPIKTSLF